MRTSTARHIVWCLLLVLFVSGGPAAAQAPKGWVQGKGYIGEFHYLEDLARDKVYEFLYMNATSKIRGAAAGFTMRPAAIK